MFRDWCTFAEENNRWEYKVQADMDDNGEPDQNPEAFGEVEHENVGADAQLHQCHAIEVEELP